MVLHKEIALNASNTKETTSDFEAPTFPKESYVASLHWSMAQFTSATNPIAPSNGYERRRGSV